MKGATGRHLLRAVSRRTSECGPDECLTSEIAFVRTTVHRAGESFVTRYAPSSKGI
jgi:hypothetical protein